ncbi:hypothetical protein EP51_00535 [Rhodococcus opacus]|uniref:Uncharacterized protein n=1 Tax=Rhodococcus opacus TaxID=37919 RepID=A0A076EDN8_RHOOP|nr:hypothetical protein EP51_00535 [Rhodococcus opacus]
MAWKHRLITESVDGELIGGSITDQAIVRSLCPAPRSHSSRRSPRKAMPTDPSARHRSRSKARIRVRRVRGPINAWPPALS